MPKCPNCNQDIDKVYFESVDTYEGMIYLDDRGNIEFDDDLKERVSEATCPKCGAIITPSLDGPYDPRVEKFLRCEKA